MYIRYFLIIGLFFLAKPTFSAVTDSVGVENKDGKKVILHKLAAKESYYSLGRKYQVSPKSIIDFNNNAALRVGDVIKIPTLVNYVSVSLTPTEKFYADKSNLTEYRVKAKESLFSIAKKFNITVDALKSSNKLKSNALQVGQLIKIPGTAKPEVAASNEEPAKLPPPPVKEKPLPKPVIDTIAVENTRERRYPANRYGLTEHNERGTAVWINDTNLDATKSLALHQTAPIGTIMKITNPMTNRSVFAKIVGRFTENVTTKDVIVVMTKAASDAVGAIDKRFYVNLTYGTSND